MNGYPFKNDRGMAVIGNKSAEHSVDYVVHGAGRFPAGGRRLSDQPPKPSEPAAVAAPGGIGVAEDVSSP